jgi:hypothetical protein
MKNRINTGKLGAGIRVRILRPWRGYPVGAIIAPPGGLRQILLQAKDQLGRQVASIEPTELIEPMAALELEPELKEENKSRKKQ